ncbi:MAG: HAD family hydrolase [Eggerthellaceae bacterium]|nr:HAD family hydrolase [Eggerthellaceae bacterium]
MPTTSQRAYKAVFFDLDGTLLPVDMDTFLQAYFKALGKYAAEHGQEPKQFTDALNKGVFAMIKEEGGRNDERFWQTFCAVLGIDESEMPAYEQLMEGFYNTAFDELGALITPTPESAKVINLLKEKGYRLYLTTMPLFPRIAVEKRVQWAGCDPQAFERITTYDNSTSTKPHLAYYRENVEAIGLKPEEILMVGNNTREDLSAMKLGLDGYLVTDWLLNPDDFDIDSVKHGSMADFLKFVEDLPKCENAAEGAGVDAAEGAETEAATGRDA